MVDWSGSVTLMRGTFDVAITAIAAARRRCLGVCARSPTAASNSCRLRNVTSEPAMARSFFMASDTNATVIGRGCGSERVPDASSLSGLLMLKYALVVYSRSARTLRGRRAVHCQKEEARKDGSRGAAYCAVCSPAVVACECATKSLSSMPSPLIFRRSERTPFASQSRGY